jgi:hypothetical protein
MAEKQTFDQVIFASLRPLMKDIVKADDKTLDSHRLRTKFKHLRNGKRNRSQKN